MASAWSRVFGFERVSLCDWPGMNASVIFLGGCNMHCPTCHNFNLAWHSDTMNVIPQDAIESYLTKRARWIDGVVITGGEATITPGLADLIRDLHKLGMPVKMDSNGMRPDVLKQLLDEDLVKLFAVDVKGPYQKYPVLTGGTTSPAEAEENLSQVFELAKQYPDKFLFRITKVPVLTDEDIQEAESYLPEGFTLKHQEYVPPRREHAETDSEARQVSGDMVA